MTETKVVKITKRDNINSLLKREDLTENERTYLIHELELLDKKNAYKSSKALEKDAQNEDFRNQIFAIVSENSGITCAQIANQIAKATGKDVTPQRVRPQLTKLIDSELVVNYKEKGVSLFKVAE